jgi:SAM-dependent methyltransferase
MNLIEISSPAGKLCLAMTRMFTTGPLRRFNQIERAQGNRFDSKENYIADRVSNISDYRQLFGSFGSFEGKTVLELGCSTGYLLNCFRQYENFTAIGAEIDPKPLAVARAQYGKDIRFVQTTPGHIPVPDSSVDVVYTIDTIEHLSQPHDIFMDVFRILKPGGKFLIHFGPWYNPNGAHLEDIIPFPWPHVMFSMDTLLNVAAHIYESPDTKHACYWYEDGKLRPNPYLDRERWREFLNDLTIRKFRRLLRALPYKTLHFQRIGFGGKSFRAGRFATGLAQVPFLNELFIKAVFCVLQKPAVASASFRATQNAA